MMEFFSTWYGMALAAVIVIAVLMAMGKIAGLVSRLLFLGLIVLAAFLYFRHLIF